MEKFASLLSVDAYNYKKTIEDLEEKRFDGLHFDILDGHFVKNFGFNLYIINSLRKITKLKFNIHLQIENPEIYINEFIKAGADILTIHPQTCNNLERELRFIKSQGAQSSIAVDPEVKIKNIEKYLPLVDNVVILTVYPGFGEQKFIEKSLQKIKELKNIILENKFPISISIDGSVNSENAEILKRYGADILIYGSSLFN